MRASRGAAAFQASWKGRHDLPALLGRVAHPTGDLFKRAAAADTNACGAIHGADLDAGGIDWRCHGGRLEHAPAAGKLICISLACVSPLPAC